MPISFVLSTIGLKSPFNALSMLPVEKTFFTTELASFLTSFGKYGSAISNILKKEY